MKIKEMKYKVGELVMCDKCLGQISKAVDDPYGFGYSVYWFNNETSVTVTASAFSETEISLFKKHLTRYINRKAKNE